MFNIIIKIILLLIILFGVILIYDARILTKNSFSFGDQNESTLGLKLIGFLITFIGGLIVYFSV